MMDWRQLSKSEQDEARKLAKKFGQSVSQIAKYWDEVNSYESGTMSKVRLANMTGWKLELTREDYLARRRKLMVQIEQVDAKLAELDKESQTASDDRCPWCLQENAVGPDGYVGRHVVPAGKQVCTGSGASVGPGVGRGKRPLEGPGGAR